VPNGSESRRRHELGEGCPAAAAGACAGRAGDSAKATCARVGSMCVMRGAKGSRTAPGSNEQGCPPRSTYGERRRLGSREGGRRRPFIPRREAVGCVTCVSR
jgi:hypothetical protein